MIKNQDNNDYYFFLKPLIYIYNQEIFPKYLLKHVFKVI